MNTRLARLSVLSLLALMALLTVVLVVACTPTSPQVTALVAPEEPQVSAIVVAIGGVQPRVEYGPESGGVVYAEGGEFGVMIQHPCSGAWWLVPPGAVVAWTDGAVEVPISDENSS